MKWPIITSISMLFGRLMASLRAVMFDGIRALRIVMMLFKEK